MKKFLQLLKIVQLFIFLPFEIFKGSKKRAYMRIKKKMISANLL
jgi:branched-subunit amino acid transport protein AzlD